MRRSCAVFPLAAVILAATARVVLPETPIEVTVTEHSDGVRWAVPIGHRRGMIAVAKSEIVVGTNELVYGKDGKLSAIEAGGTLLCLDRATGKRLWQRNHAYREGTGLARSGVQSTPRIDGDRVYYVSNCGELVCVKLKNGDVVWKIDMVADLGVCFSAS